MQNQIGDGELRVENIYAMRCPRPAPLISTQRCNKVYSPGQMQCSGMREIKKKRHAHFAVLRFSLFSRSEFHFSPFSLCDIRSTWLHWRACDGVRGLGAMAHRQKEFQKFEQQNERKLSSARAQSTQPGPKNLCLVRGEKSARARQRATVHSIFRFEPKQEVNNFYQ